MLNVATSLSILSLSLTAFALAACGGAQHPAVSGLAAANSIVDAVITGASATPVNGGVNPDAFALTVKGTVVGGANRCEAAASRVAMIQQRVGTVIYVRAVRYPRTPGVVCTQEYSPVNVVLTTTVRDFASDVTAVIVKNVDRLGNDVATDAL